MTGRERVRAMMRGETTDHLPLMPITMMFAADRAGIPYGRYASDGVVLAEAQVRVGFVAPDGRPRRLPAPWRAAFASVPSVAS